MNGPGIFAADVGGVGVFIGGGADGYFGWSTQRGRGRWSSVWAGGGSVCGQDIDFGGRLFFASDEFINGRCRSRAGDCGGGEGDGGASVDGGGAGLRGVFDHVDPGGWRSRILIFRADWAGKIKMFIQSFTVGGDHGSGSLLSAWRGVHMVRDIVIWATVIVTVLSTTTYVIRARKVMVD